jgi:hypothetical protein
MRRPSSPSAELSTADARTRQRSFPAPPIFGSISHSVIVQPGGPSSHRLSSAGVVNASYQVARRVEDARHLDLAIAVSRHCEFADRGHHCSSLGPRTPSSPVNCLELFQDGIQRLKSSFPKLPISLEPSRGFRESLGLQSPRPALRIAATRDQPRALEHLEMLRDRRLAHRKRLRQLADRRLPRREPRQYRPPSRIGQRRERDVQTVRQCHMDNPSVLQPVGYVCIRTSRSSRLRGR